MSALASTLSLGVQSSMPVIVAFQDFWGSVKARDEEWESTCLAVTIEAEFSSYHLMVRLRHVT